jgi:hypothetical protein
LYLFAGFGTSLAQYLPDGISYQAVARNSQGDELANTSLNVKISILPGNQSDEAEYSEIHSVTTNKYGLFTLVIGSGSPEAGAVSRFSEIDWGKAAHFLKVEVDFGNGYISMGTTQMLAVPYALYAKTAGSAAVGGSDDDATNELITDVKLNGNVLEIHEGDLIQSIDLSKFDIQTINFQDLSISGDTLKLSDDSTPVLLDKYINTDNQKLIYDSVEQHLWIENGLSKPIDLKNIIERNDQVNDADADPANEIQHLELTGNTLELNKGDGTTVSSVTIDADNENELQDFIYRNDSLYLDLVNKPVKINLSKYLDNTDEQDLVLRNDSVIIDNGKGILLPDASNTNEIQELSIDGDYNLELSPGGGSVSVKDADSEPTNELQDLTLRNDSIVISNGKGIDASTLVNPATAVVFEVSNANINLDPLETIDPIILGTEKFDESNNLSTYHFTAPFTGIYHLYIDASFSTSLLKFYLWKNSVVEKAYEGDNSATDDFFIKLTSGDTIKFSLYNDSGSTGGVLLNFNFRGYLIR